MPLSIQCPNAACAKVSAAPDGSSGKTVRCKHCGHSFVARPTVDGGASETRPNSAPSTTGVSAVGRFQIRQRLGAGAFGTVYRAFDPQLDREVAVKVPNPGVLGDPKRVERFLREAKAAAQLRHPHIVPVFDAGRDGDTLYIASAFIRGKPLSDAIDEGGSEFRRAAALVRQLAEALAYAHEQGVVHRDVKPDNMLLDEQDRVHLLDFGLAARQDETAKLTNDGAVMGTPSYMAPEQAAGKSAEAGPAADQYAAGVVLYELLTGRVPFEGPPAIVIHNAIHTPPDAPSKSRPDVPRDLETVCLKAMGKRPEDRYPTCQAMADDLRRWLDGDPISARRLRPVEQLTRWAKRNKLVAGLSAAVVVALTAGVLVSAGFAVEARAEAGRADREASTARATAEREEAERKRAEGERTAADDARKVAVTEREKATEQKERADKALAQLVAEEAVTRRGLYTARVQLARSAWTERRPDAVGRSLPLAAPAAGKEDLRGFEWYYLSNLITADDALAFPLPAVQKGLAPGGRAAYWYGDVYLNTPSGVSVSPDEKWIATVIHRTRMRDTGNSYRGTGSDYTVVLWDAATGREVRRWPDMMRAAFSRDSASLVMLEHPEDDERSGVGKVMVSDIPPTMPPVGLVAFAGNSQRVQFTTDGKIAVGSRVIDPKTNESTDIPKHPEGVGAGLYGVVGTGAAQGRVIVHAYIPPRVVGYVRAAIAVEGASPELAKRAAEIEKLTDGGTVYWDMGGRYLILRQRAPGKPQAVKVWDVNGLVEIADLPDVPTGYDHFAVCGERRLVAGWSSNERLITIWDGATKAVVRHLSGHKQAIVAGAFGGKGEKFVTTGGDGVRVWPVQQFGNASAAGAEVREAGPIVKRPQDQIGDAAGFREAYIEVAPDNTHAVFQHAELNGTPFNARLIDLATGADVTSYKGVTVTGSFRSMTFSSNGLMAYHDGKDVVVHDTVVQKEVFRIPDRPNSPGLLFSPKGDRLLVVTTREPNKPWGKMSSFRVWDTATRQELPELHRADLNSLSHPIREHVTFDAAGVPRVVAFTPTGKSVFSPTGDEFFHSAGHLERRVGGAVTARVACADFPTFTADGRRIACIGENRVVVVLDAATLEELLVLKTPFLPNTMSFTPDGRTLVGVGWLGHLVIWSGAPRATPQAERQRGSP